jgi:carbon monoxide dehydrogenase subunit G
VKLEHSFELPAPLETVWSLLLDVERLAPCLPGGEVTERIGDARYTATVRVKIGPMTLAYSGEVEIAEADEAARRSVMLARATETRGHGTAEATITTSLRANGAATRAEIETQLELTGRAGRLADGVVDEVAQQVMGEFAACLSKRVSGADPAAHAEPVHAIGVLVHALAARVGRLIHHEKP